MATAPERNDGKEADQLRPPSLVAGERRLAQLIERLRGDGEQAPLKAGARPWYDVRWRSDRIGRIAVDVEAAGVRLAGPLQRLVAGNPELSHLVRERWPFRALDVDTEDGRIRLSGLPQFDANGGFAGYEGFAWLSAPANLIEGSRALAEFAHEVRSPLTAISGFAQFVEGEVLGPVPPAAQRLATDILAETRRLLAALDDLTDNARAEGQRMPVALGWRELAEAVDPVVARYADAAAARRVSIAVEGDTSLQVWADIKLLERCVERLVATLLPFAGEREVIRLTGQGWTGEFGGLSLSRPKSLSKLTAAELLEHGSEPVDANAPLLGLAFTLRLVQRLMESMDGELQITPGQIRLRMAAGGVHALTADVAPDADPA